MRGLSRIGLPRPFAASNRHTVAYETGRSPNAKRGPSQCGLSPLTVNARNKTQETATKRRGSHEQRARSRLLHLRTPHLITHLPREIFAT
jgi:hypothetical protein